MGVTQQFVNGAEVAVVFQQVSGKTMPQGVRGGGFGKPCRSNRRIHGSLEKVLTFVVATHDFATRIGGNAGRGKRPEPGHCLPA
jgi:hypothetical protein